MGVVVIILSMSLDGFITGPDAYEEQPLGTADNVLRPGGERWMIDEVFAAAGAVVAGRRVYDHVHGWGEEPPALAWASRPSCTSGSPWATARCSMLTRSS